MPTSQAAALTFCQQSPVTRVLPLAALERGTARVLEFSDGALLLHDPTFFGHMLCWDDEAAARRLLTAFSADELLMMEHDTLEQDARAIHGFTGGMVCHSCAHQAQVPMPVSQPVALRLLRPRHQPMVNALHQEASAALIAYALIQGRLFGGYVDDELVGFIGYHEEGSLGMLYVLPSHRRRGYAQAMEAQLVNRCLQRGQRVFGQIKVGNLASFQLHRGMGYTIADTPGSWHWR